MAISLSAKDYCQNCSKFEPEAMILFANNIPEHTLVFCKNREKCEDIEKHIRGEINEKRKL